MSFALSIQDQTTAGDVLTDTVVLFPVEEISVKTLIESRVAQEVANYKNQDNEIFSGLIKPKRAENVLNGFKIQKKRTIDVAEQQEVAINAFQSNGFFLLVNDQQLTALDDRILITPNTKVVFLKLIPLVGG